MVRSLNSHAVPKAALSKERAQLIKQAHHVRNFRLVYLRDVVALSISVSYRSCDFPRRIDAGSAARERLAQLNARRSRLAQHLIPETKARCGHSSLFQWSDHILLELWYEGNAENVPPASCPTGMAYPTEVLDRGGTRPQ